MSAPSGKRSILAMVLDRFPWLERPAPATYIVGKSDTPGSGLNADGTCNLEAPTGSTLAPLPSVPQWSSSQLVEPAVGSEALVVFRDGDRRRPAIVAFTPIAIAAAKPTARVADLAGRLAVDSAGVLYYAAGASGVASYVAVPVYPFPGPPPGAFAGADITITSGSAIVRTV